MINQNIISVEPLSFPWATQDPFLFCAHHADSYPRGNDALGPATSLEGRMIGQDFTIKDGWRMYHGDIIPGFPVHPHRGFETITIAKEGIVDHSDSLGAAGRFSKGDVQWMTAGKGVQHSEMFPLIHKDKENPLEIFQVWLNLPKASKMVEPHFKMLWAEDIPVVRDDSKGMAEINVIAGAFRGTPALPPTPDSWAANPENEVAVWTIKMEAHTSVDLPGSVKEVTRTLYFYKGNKLQIEGKVIDSYHSVTVKSTADLSLTTGDEDCYLLVLQGRPINERVVQYGPFVMNTEEEIRQTFVEYQRTEFGGWPWPDRDQHHGREKGRFALHADGREEYK
ncbi:MAG TPA: pirin [Flavobacteriales bacterium]|nr:pirin [Flavobacteriales bacterium]